MPKKRTQLSSDYVTPIYMNRLQGRMLYVPSNNHKGREFLIVHDRLNSLEDWWELVRVLNRFGAVTKTDLPGFGGMQSFYHIKEKPSINRLADYLAAFVKLRYRRKQLTIVGVGFGFVIVTRMLQSYPDVARKVNLVISINGYAHKDDFVYGKSRKVVHLIGGWLGSQRIVAAPLKIVWLRRTLIRGYYNSMPRYRSLVSGMKDSAKYSYINAKVENLQNTNLRTQLSLLSETMRLDNCKKSVEIPLWHVALKTDPYLNQSVIEQHLRIIYKNYHHTSVNLSPTKIAILDLKSAAQLLPTKLKRLLSRH